MVYTGKVVLPGTTVRYTYHGSTTGYTTLVSHLVESIDDAQSYRVITLG